jgi:hypothetical protein
MLFLVTVFALPTASASAQGDAAQPESTTYDFDDDVVLGDIEFPRGEQLVVRRPTRRGTLIRPRERFVPEMLESVEDL